MGIYDRDYYRRPAPSGFGRFSAWSATIWLIAINVAVFVLDELLRGRRHEVGPLMELGAFSVETAVYHLQLWRFITCQFLHFSVAHIFFNMLGLYFFGPIAEAHFGPRRYLAFYLSCGVAGALCYIVLWAAGVLAYFPGTTMVGASAGIFGVLVAAAVIAPRLTVQLWFPPIPLTMRSLVLIYVGIAAYTVITGGANAGGQAAHLGGAIWGYALMKRQQWLNVMFFNRRGRRRRTAFKDWTNDPDH